MSFRVWSLIAVLLIGSVAESVWAGKPAEAEEQLRRGQSIYEQSCQWCHGTTGDGEGPAAFFGGAYSSPRPRDFTIGNYKFRSTPSGAMPTDQDLFRTLTDGIPGMMPSFAGLSETQRWQVIAYIKKFATENIEDSPTTMVKLGPPIPSSLQSIERGRAVFFTLRCHTCHGENGKGQSKVARRQKLADSRDLPIMPTDLTNRFSFKRGAMQEDIVRTLMTGLDGTPMPSYVDQLEGQEEDAWHVANYILSLSPVR